MRKLGTLGSLTEIHAEVELFALRYIFLFTDLLGWSSKQFFIWEVCIGNRSSYLEALVRLKAFCFLRSFLDLIAEFVSAFVFPLKAVHADTDCTFAENSPGWRIFCEGVWEIRSLFFFFLSSILSRPTSSNSTFRALDFSFASLVLAFIFFRTAEDPESTSAKKQDLWFQRCKLEKLHQPLRLIWRNDSACRRAYFVLRMSVEKTAIGDVAPK